MDLFTDLTWCAVFDFDAERSTVGAVAFPVFCNKGRDRRAMTTLTKIISERNF